ncbi:hypothetical protein [Thalassolituus marinus]|uniref:CRISPR-associated protein n=1 Tax=Thalassolituus marinus TaxID=671053 RepID=A0ABS7ZVV0_9GAMM|nr:hypothetical protein [Thalassolituus marinus]MCA6065343.1 hypothetical protein [Thalassolituus marinus]
MNDAKHTIFLTGKMLAEEPLTVTHKDAQTGKNHRLPRAGRSEQAQPYWPASNIRGALRHAMTRAIAQAAEASGSKLNLASAFMLGQGTDIDGIIKDRDGMIDGDKDLRAVNPGISILGRWKLPGKMDVGNAYPITPDCVAYYGQGARRIMFEVTPELVDDLDAADQQRLSELLSWQTEASANKADIKSQIRALNDQMKTADSAASKRLLKDQIEALKEQESVLNKGGSDDGATGIRRPLPGYEAFNAGTEFKQSITLHNVTMMEAGLFVAALVQFMRYPQLGAKSAYNNGKVAFEWDVLRYESKSSLKPVKTGELRLSAMDGIDLQDDLLRQSYEAWCQASADLKRAEIDFQRLA